MITQWYPKPAVFDQNGWHPMPYLSQGEFYSVDVSNKTNPQVLGHHPTPNQFTHNIWVSNLLKMENLQYYPKKSNLL